ncbi:hypothetical protein Tco_0808826 [Tanacetum coccineum]
MIEGHQIRRIYVDSGSSSEIMHEHCFRSFNTNVWSRLRKYKASLVGFSGETYLPLGLIDLWNQNEKSWSGRLDHSLHDQVPNGPGSRHNENKQGSPIGVHAVGKMLGSWKEIQWRQHMEQMSRIQEQALLRKEPMLLENREEDESMIGKIVIDIILSVNYGLFKPQQNLRQGHVSLLGGGRRIGIANGISIQVFLTASQGQ